MAERQNRRPHALELHALNGISFPLTRLKPFFPKSHGKPRVDDRRVLSGIIFINRNGLRWCDAPKEYGPAKTLYNRWKRWSDNGVFARIMVGLAAESASKDCSSIRSPCGA